MNPPCLPPQTIGLCTDNKTQPAGHVCNRTLKTPTPHSFPNRQPDWQHGAYPACHRHPLPLVRCIRTTIHYSQGRSVQGSWHPSPPTPHSPPDLYLQQRLWLFEVIPAVAPNKHHRTADAHNTARVTRQRYHALLLLLLTTSSTTAVATSKPCGLHLPPHGPHQWTSLLLLLLLLGLVVSIQETEYVEVC